MLIKQVEEKITIPRDALQKCKELGFTDAIKIIEQLDRAVIEKWPSEKLYLIGGDRRKVEKITYSFK